MENRKNTRKTGQIDERLQIFPVNSLLAKNFDLRPVRSGLRPPPEFPALHCLTALTGIDLWAATAILRPPHLSCHPNLRKLYEKTSFTNDCRGYCAWGVCIARSGKIDFENGARRRSDTAGLAHYARRGAVALCRDNAASGRRNRMVECRNGRQRHIQHHRNPGKMRIAAS